MTNAQHKKRPNRNNEAQEWDEHWEWWFEDTLTLSRRGGRSYCLQQRLRIKCPGFINEVLKRRLGSISKQEIVTVKAWKAPGHGAVRTHLIWWTLEAIPHSQCDAHTVNQRLLCDHQRIKWLSEFTATMLAARWMGVTLFPCEAETQRSFVRAEGQVEEIPMRTSHPDVLRSITSERVRVEGEDTEVQLGWWKEFVRHDDWGAGHGVRWE